MMNKTSPYTIPVYNWCHRHIVDWKRSYKLEDVISEEEKSKLELLRNEKDVENNKFPIFDNDALERKFEKVGLYVIYELELRDKYDKQCTFSYFMKEYRKVTKEINQVFKSINKELYKK